MVSPVFTVGRDTRTLALAGAMAQAAEVHSHCLLFSAGAAATNIAVKALATARKFLRNSSAGGRELLVQPTLRGRAPGGADAVAFDVFITPAPLAPELVPGGTGPGNRQVRVTAGSFEADWARNLVANMPRRGQTVMKVAGAYAVENAVKSVALARPTLQRQHGQDFVFVPMWCDDAGFTPAMRQAGGSGGGGVRRSDDGDSGGDGGVALQPRRKGKDGVLVSNRSSGQARSGAQGEGGESVAARSRGGGSGGGGGAGSKLQLRPKLRLAVMRCKVDDPACVLPATGAST
ncbi:hypothetical protein MNEG_9148 [Monoraphidium neglectum]|jgi:stage V sporulation protein SpoVS|uniref:Uncharacterized protein n=1 Tax=Monoraphidium neglectum TaxID=145388 RepID=A0A0D2M5T4_9CHLO|nr:hypothetical protein MNEG_9148 [Monoraphidium neglectum]KIY98814.1 hypothetical protein MNEG_9148 [Monoraphidium neglectum]|eukprot:XP_013897834.1 hypothetical protein MNEG_9148 [Monoraphidium neglectum]